MSECGVCGFYSGEFCRCEKDLAETVRYLWNAWAGAEGDGQPLRWVFGQFWWEGEGKGEDGAPPNVQSVIRRLIKDLPREVK